VECLEEDEAGDPNEVLEGPANVADFTDDEDDWFEPEGADDLDW
jgi:hypothetical protein